MTAFILLLLPLSIFAGTVEDWGKNHPDLLEKSLPKESYMEVMAQKLSRPKLLWVNEDYLAKHGIEMTSDLEQRILDTFAYGIPNKSEPPSAFIANDKKSVFIDYYGGRGNNDNLGSGRAASMGKVQIKGIGPTPLVAHARRDHSNGVASFMEGVREAIWGEVNQDLPYGGNQVIALIDRGTTIKGEHGDIQPNVLIVREDPLRPAHFMELLTQDPALKIQDIQRTSKTIKYLTQALPVPSEFQNATEFVKIKAGLEEYTQRVAKQYAYLFAHRLYHGATSPSNFQPNGALLDYGTQTAQSGYGEIRRILKFEDPAGKTDMIKTILLDGFAESLRRQLPADLKDAVPQVSDLITQFDRVYQESLEKEFLSLTGVPTQIIEKMSSQETRPLARLLIDVATEGSLQAWVYLGIPDKMSKYDLNEMLVELAHGESTSLNVLGNSRKKEFLLLYETFMAHAEEIAAEEKIKSGPFQTLRQLRARLLNQPRTKLYNAHIVSEYQPLIQDYMENKKTSALNKAINETIESSRYFNGKNSLSQVVLQSQRIPGLTIRHLYNAQEDSYKLILEGAQSSSWSIDGAEKWSKGRKTIFRISTEASAEILEKNGLELMGPHGKLSLTFPESLRPRPSAVSSLVNCSVFKNCASLFLKCIPSTK